jgi:hypothetical protein
VGVEAAVWLVIPTNIAADRNTFFSEFAEAEDVAKLCGLDIWKDVVDCNPVDMDATPPIPAVLIGPNVADDCGLGLKASPV